MVIRELIAMKSKIILSFTALLLVACVRESVQPEENGPKTFDCFTVSMEDSPMTKVHMEDGGAVKWDVGDCIGVYSDTQAPVPYYRGEDGKFYGDPITGTEFYAFYPYWAFEYDSDNPASLKCISLESYTVSKSFTGRMNFPMVAKSESSHLFFKQTCGLIHIRMQSSRYLQSIELRSNHKEAVAGGGSISLQDENPTFCLSIGNGTVTDNYDSNIGPVPYSHPFIPDDAKDDGLWDFYIPMPEMTLQEGFFLSIYYDDYSLVRKNIKKLFEIKRGYEYHSLLDLDSIIEENEEEIQRERSALVKLYESLGGEHWINQDNWCSDKPLSEWSGVTIDGDGTVMSLYLWDSSIKGTLPEEIGDLVNLQYLNIGGLTSTLDGTFINGIEGNVPESIGNLVNLTQLSLSCTGYLPKSLSNLTHLNSLCFIGVCIDGGIELGEYTSGGLGCIANMEKLENIQLMDCRGTLSADFSKLDHLIDVHLGANGLKGPLPNFSDAALSIMRNCTLNSNCFTGPVPSNYALALDSPAFQYNFWLIDNCISGELPVEITSHPSFPETAWLFVANQKEGSKIEIDKVPASRYTYPTLDGGELNLGDQYSKAEYTMIVRWSELCLPSRGFLPTAIELSDKFRSYGLQTVWAYAGGEDASRKSYMQEVGLDEDELHILECHDYGLWDHRTDHVVWSEWLGVASPFVEVVDKDGNIVFIDDPTGCYSQQPFSFNRSKLEAFLSNTFGADEVFYSSSDYSADKRVHTIQEAQIENGINVVLMGDAFSDRMIEDGSYHQIMQKAVDALFSEEPYKSFKSCFNIYYVDVVSTNEVYNGITALDTWYGEGSSVGGNDKRVFEYASCALSDVQMDDALIIVMMNRNYYAGTCYMYSTPGGDYGRGPSIAYFPTSSSEDTFNGLVSHEAGGHGFAKLADEYDYPGVISEAEVADRRSMEPFGWWKNIDFTSDPEKVKWAKFIIDPRYESEGIGVYEGACTYTNGAWRPTSNSIMRYNSGGFNAPSREAIYYRIHKLAYGAEWEYNYEDFVTWDLAHRTPAATSARSARPNFVEKEFQPLAPPVVVKKDWREVVREGKNNR